MEVGIPDEVDGFLLRLAWWCGVSLSRHHGVIVGHVVVPGSWSARNRLVVGVVVITAVKSNNHKNTNGSLGTSRK